MGLSLQSQTHTDIHRQILHAPRVPLIALLPWVPLSSLKLRQERGCRQEQGGKERLLRQSPPACLVRSVGACGPVCLCRSMGGVWESTLALNDLIETPTRSSAPPPCVRTGAAVRLRGIRHNHCSNLLSGQHKGEVRGQISAARWRSILMVMSSQTSLHQSGAVGEKSVTHWVEARKVRWVTPLRTLWKSTGSVGWGQQV